MGKSRYQNQAWVGSLVFASSQVGLLISLPEVTQGCLTGNIQPTSTMLIQNQTGRASPLRYYPHLWIFRSANNYHRKEVPPTEMVRNGNIKEAIENSNLSGRAMGRIPAVKLKERWLAWPFRVSKVNIVSFLSVFWLQVTNRWKYLWWGSWLNMVDCQQ